MAGDTGRGVESNCTLEIACQNVCQTFLHCVRCFFLLPFVFWGVGPRPRLVIASYYGGRVLRCLNTSNWVGQCGNLSFPSFHNHAGRYTGVSDAKRFVWEFFGGPPCYYPLLIPTSCFNSLTIWLQLWWAQLSPWVGFQMCEGTAFLDIFLVGAQDSHAAFLQ